MIDWYSVGFGALWILGLSLELAALSFAYYQASLHELRFIRALGMPACRFMIDLGLVLFCLGWTGSVSAVWQRIVWAVLALIFIVIAWRDIKMGNA